MLKNSGLAITRPTTSTTARKKAVAAVSQGRLIFLPFAGCPGRRGRQMPPQPSPASGREITEFETMSVLIDKNTKVSSRASPVQQGTFHAQQMLDYGTRSWAA